MKAKADGDAPRQENKDVIGTLKAIIYSKVDQKIMLFFVISFIILLHNQVEV